MSAWAFLLELRGSYQRVARWSPDNDSLRRGVVQLSRLYDPVAIYLPPKAFAALVEETIETARWVQRSRWDGASADGLEIPYDSGRTVFVHCKRGFLLDVPAIAPGPTFAAAKG